MASKAPSSAVSGGGGGAPTFEQIARRSYELYLARGGESSTAQQLQDWLAAEAELRSPKTPAS